MAGEESATSAGPLRRGARAGGGKRLRRAAPQPARHLAPDRGLRRAARRSSASASISSSSARRRGPPRRRAAPPAHRGQRRRAASGSARRGSATASATGRSSRRASRGPVDAEDASPSVKQLMNVVTEMAIAAGQPMPRVYLIDEPIRTRSRPAATRSHASIAVTTGLLETMNRDELQGVIAHEMSHVRNLDIRKMTLVAALLGAVLLLSDWATRLRLGHPGRPGLEAARRRRGRRPPRRDPARPVAPDHPARAPDRTAPRHRASRAAASTSPTPPGPR